MSLKTMPEREAEKKYDLSKIRELVTKPLTKEKVPRAAAGRASKRPPHGSSPEKIELLKKWAILIVFSLGVALIISHEALSPPKEYAVGDVALADVRATAGFLVEDKETTVKHLAAANRSVLPVYDLDDEVAQNIKKRVLQAFELMREQVSSEPRKASAKLSPPATIDAKNAASKPAPPDPLEQKQLGHLLEKDDFETILGVEIEDNTYEWLIDIKFAPEVAAEINRLASQTLSRGIVSSESPLVRDVNKGIMLRDLKTGKETLVQDASRLIDLEQARKYISGLAKSSIYHRLRPHRRYIVQIAQSITQPNVTYNRDLTQKRQHEAQQSVKPVFYRIKKGEIIAREGEKITEDILVKLRSQAQSRAPHSFLGKMIGIAVFLMVLLMTMYHFGTYHIRKFSGTSRDILFCLMTMFIVFLTAVLVNFLDSAAGKAIPFLHFSSLIFCIPTAAVAMLVTIFLSMEAALMCGVVTSILMVVV
ncbi:MAG: hypothetical protein HQK59_12645, partial [Deltaproteobacteria bacterium]|nr:hypothetical protein [Deltaproteobacteria bacterium]